MGKPAELSDDDREKAEYTAEWIWRGVLEGEGAPLDMLKRIASQYKIPEETLLLNVAIVLLEHRTKLRGFSDAHVMPDLVGEAQRALGNEHDEAMKRAKEARMLYGKPSASTRVRIDRGDFQRVAGMVLCETCQVAYVDHDPVIGFPWLRHGCDGRLLKP